MKRTTCYPVDGGTVPSTPDARRLVRVWFGSHVIATQVAEPAFAARFEAAMRRRFASCLAGVLYAVMLHDIARELRGDR